MYFYRVQFYALRMDVRLARTLLGQTQGGCGEPPCISMSFYVEWSRGADKQRPARPAAAGAPPGIAALAHLPCEGRLFSRAPPAQKAPHAVGSWPREARPEGLWHFAGKHPCSRSSAGADACIRPRVDASIDPYKSPGIPTYFTLSKWWHAAQWPLLTSLNSGTSAAQRSSA